MDDFGRLGDEECAFPAVMEILQELAEGGEGDEEEQRKRLPFEVHKILGHPPNRLFPRS